VQQQPSAWLGSTFGTMSNRAEPVPTAADVRKLLPAGSRVIDWRRSPAPLFFRTRYGLAKQDLVGLDYADPLARGMVEQVSGRAPRTGAEIALTTSLATATGLQIGDAVHAVDPVRTFHVVGLVRDTGSRTARTAYVLPSVVPPPTGSLGPQVTIFLGDHFGWLARTPRPVSWSRVLQLNDAGFLVLSRAVFLDPPPESQVPAEVRGSGSVSSSTISTLVLVGGMALLEVVLLAGPAFAVSARRRRRELALIAAVGGRRSDLRRVVLADGVVLGLGGGLLAALLAVAAMAVLIPTVGPLLSSRVPGPFDVRPVELAALVGISLLTSLIAAAFPARTAARTDVVAALAGRRGAVRSRRSVPVVGLLVAGFGLVVTLGAIRTVTAQVLLVGVALIELGLIISTPALLGLISRTARRLPLSGRMALRDAGRNRASAAPAVAAVMAAVVGAVAAAVGVASADHEARHGYAPYLPRRDAWVALAPGQAGSADAVASAVRSAFPDGPVHVVRTAAATCDRVVEFRSGGSSCTGFSIGTARRRADERGSAFGSPLFADSAQLSALVGRQVPQAAGALDRGAAVVFDRNVVSADGTVTVTVVRRTLVRGAPAGPGHDRRTVRLPAVVVDGGFRPATIVLPLSAAARLHVGVTPTGVLADLAERPLDAQEQYLNARLAELDLGLSVYLETGYQSRNGWLPVAFVTAAMIVAVLAALIATALANVDGSADLSTLAAVGAAPRVRRRLSMARAGVIAGLGVVLGTAAGFAPAAAWVRAQHTALIVPVTPIVATVLGIPLIAGGLAWLFVRSRLPVERPSA
jgi:putative ABC transport system permease protein